MVVTAIVEAVVVRRSSRAAQFAGEFVVDGDVDGTAFGYVLLLQGLRSSLFLVSDIFICRGSLQLSRWMRAGDVCLEC